MHIFSIMENKGYEYVIAENDGLAGLNILIRLSEDKFHLYYLHQSKYVILCRPRVSSIYCKLNQVVFSELLYPAYQYNNSSLRGSDRLFLSLPHFYIFFHRSQSCEKKGGVLFV